MTDFVMTYAVGIKGSAFGKQRFLNLGRCDVPRRLMTPSDLHSTFVAAQAEAEAAQLYAPEGVTYVARAFKAVC